MRGVRNLLLRGLALCLLNITRYLLIKQIILRKYLKHGKLKMTSEVTNLAIDKIKILILNY